MRVLVGTPGDLVNHCEQMEDYNKPSNVESIDLRYGMTWAPNAAPDMSPNITSNMLHVWHHICHYVWYHLWYQIYGTKYMIPNMIYTAYGVR